MVSMHEARRLVPDIAKKAGLSPGDIRSKPSAVPTPSALKDARSMPGCSPIPELRGRSQGSQSRSVDMCRTINHAVIVDQDGAREPRSSRLFARCAPEPLYSLTPRTAEIGATNQTTSPSAASNDDTPMISPRCLTDRASPQ